MKSNLSSLRLLVFDWDGTVMDSLGNIVACTEKALEELGLEAPSGEEIRATIGLHREESLDRLFPHLGPEERTRAVERMKRLWIETYRHQSVLIEGVRPALDQLRERYFLAVATGKSRAGLEHDLEATGLRELFLATRTADDGASKPHPQIVLDLMDELGAVSRETLVVGDTTFDLEMARNAGCASLGVLTGSHSREQLDACGPLDVIESARLVPSWLEERRS